MTKRQLIGLIVMICPPLTVLSVLSCQAQQRRPNRYLIPDGYVGWVRINYRIKDAPVTVIEDGYYIFKFPMSGVIDTSSEGEEGFATDEYYYYSDDQRRLISHNSDNGLIWGGVAFGSKTVPSKEPTRFAEFFVGTKQQFDQIGSKCKDSDLNPIVGPIEKCLSSAGDPSPNDD